MKRTLTILVLVLSLFTLACKKDTPSTEPTKEPTPDTPKNEAKLVPLDQFDAVDTIWKNALPAVVSCVQKRIDETKQKGIEGFLIIEARIGKEKNPIDIRIKEQKLNVDNLEPCLKEILAQLEFPVWGYWATSQYSYTINVGY